MFNPKSLNAEEFINHQEILDTLDYAEKNKNNIELIEQILEKAKPRKTERGVECSGLSHREASVLLACENKEMIEKMYNLLGEKLHIEIWGNPHFAYYPILNIETHDIKILEVIPNKLNFQ